MTPFARVLVDQSHSSAWSIDADHAALMNPANPGDASLARSVAVLRERGTEVRAHTDGELSPSALAEVDVLVVAHPPATCRRSSPPARSPPSSTTSSPAAGSSSSASATTTPTATT